MKTRVLSLVLAVIMVVSLAAVFSINASAAEAAEGVTVTLGTVYATPGSFALVDVYVSAKSLPATHDHLRNWQFDFTGLAVSSENDNHDLYVSGGSAYFFSNLTSNTIGNTSDTGYDCGTAAQILSRGGWKVGSVAFEVPSDATGEIAVSIEKITSLTFEDADLATYKEIENTTTVDGKVVIVDTLEGVMPAKAGADEDYAIPAVVDGTVYGKMTKAGKLTGSFGTLVVPATITSVAATAVSGAEYDKIVLKGTNLDKSTVGIFVEKAGTAIYYTKRANGADTTKDNIDDYIENDSENEPEVFNILQVSADVFDATVGEETLTAFVFGVAANDLDYDELTIVLEGNGKVKEKTVNGVYTTVRGVATTGEGTTEAAQAVPTVEGFKYIAALAVRGIPSGTYTVTLYGTTADFNGNPIVVCSETVTVTV